MPREILTAGDCTGLGRQPSHVEFDHVSVDQKVIPPHVLAIEALVQRSRGVVADSLAWALSRSHLGEPLADALESVPGEFGEPLRQLVRPLVVAQRYGAELLPALETLAVDVRRQRRNRAGR